MRIFRTSSTASRAGARDMMRMICAVLIGIGGTLAVNALIKTRTRPAPPTVQPVADGGNQQPAGPLLLTAPSNDSASAERGMPLSPEDCDAIVRQCPSVRNAAPLVRVRTNVTHGKHRWAPNWIYGTTPALLDVRDWTKLSEGSCFTDADVRNAGKVCVIGQTIARELYDGGSVLGKEVRVRNTPLVVVGVLSAKGVNMYGMDQDDILLAPWTTIEFRVPADAADERIPLRSGANPIPSDSSPAALGGSTPAPARFFYVIGQIAVSTASPGNNAAAAREVTALLRQRHHIAAQQPDDFDIRDLTALINKYNASEHKPADAGHAVFYVNSASTTDTSSATMPAKAPTGATVAATGTIEPRDAVDVGAQVVGRIVSLGIDADGKPIDFRSRVKRGMVLANIDPTSYKVELESAEAALKGAVAAADSAEARKALYEAQQAGAADAWARAQKLHPKDDVASPAIADADYRGAKSAFEVVNANLRLGDALIKEAQLNVERARVEKQKAQANVDYCTIRSPVDGVIIDRRVNVGQWVVGVADPSSLFLIAGDLKQMQIWAAVNEADVKKVFENQPVIFSVDSFPRELFIGRVEKIRLNARMAENEVTYVVEVNISNADGRFIPYMTANVEFEIAPPGKAPHAAPQR